MIFLLILLDLASDLIYSLTAIDWTYNFSVPSKRFNKSFNISPWNMLGRLQH